MMSDLIGRSYKLEFYPFENTQNLGFPVIDMGKYTTAHPSYYQSVPIKESYSEYESFSGIERYETKIQKTKTVSTGAQLDFKFLRSAQRVVIRMYLSKLHIRIYTFSPLLKLKRQALYFESASFFSAQCLIINSVV